jgi:hypothetical protein
MATPPPGDHLFVLDPPSRWPRFWTPWACICGVGGTGADEAGATFQFELHVAGMYPALIEPAGAYTECHVVNGRTIWCKP